MLLVHSFLTECGRSTGFESQGLSIAWRRSVESLISRRSNIANESPAFILDIRYLQYIPRKTADHLHYFICIGDTRGPIRQTATSSGPYSQCIMSLTTQFKQATSRAKARTSEGEDVKLKLRHLSPSAFDKITQVFQNKDAIPDEPQRRIQRYFHCCCLIFSGSPYPGEKEGLAE